MKKLLPILVACTLVFTQVDVVFAQSRDSDLQDARENNQLSSKNYEAVKAYAAYLASPTDDKAVQALAKSLGMEKPEQYSAKNTFEVLNKTKQNLFSYLGSHDPFAFANSNKAYTAEQLKQFTETVVKPIEQQKNLASTELNFVQRDVNSQKIADGINTKEANLRAALKQENDATKKKALEDELKKIPSEKSLAEVIRDRQDLADLQNLGCVEGSQVPRSAKCDDLMGRTHFPGTGTTISKDEYQRRITGSNQQLSQIETEMQDALKQSLATEHINVSKILSFQSGDNKQTSYIPNGGNPGGALYFISRMIDVLVIVVSSVAVVTLIIGGYMFMFSGGDEQQRENGKDVLIYTVFGLIFVYASYAIVSLIQGLIYF